MTSACWVNIKILPDMHEWLKNRVAKNGTSKRIEIEKILQKEMDGISLTSVASPLDHVEELANAIMSGKLGNVYRPSIKADIREIIEMPNVAIEDAKNIPVSENLSPREAWYARHGHAAPVTKPVAPKIDITEKYPAFGDDE